MKLKMKKIILIALLLTIAKADKVYQVPYSKETLRDKLYTMLFLKVNELKSLPSVADKEYIDKLKFEIRVIKKRLKEVSN